MPKNQYGLETCVYKYDDMICGQEECALVHHITGGHDFKRESGMKKRVLVRREFKSQSELTAGAIREALKDVPDEQEIEILLPIRFNNVETFERYVIFKATEEIEDGS